MYMLRIFQVIQLLGLLSLAFAIESGKEIKVKSSSNLQIYIGLATMFAITSIVAVGCSICAKKEEEATQYQRIDH